MKRTVTTIKQYDYTSKEEFEKDVKAMKEKGYRLIDGMYGGWFNHGEITCLNDDNYEWKYTAYFIKSEFM